MFTDIHAAMAELRSGQEASPNAGWDGCGKRFRATPRGVVLLRGRRPVVEGHGDEQAVSLCTAAALRSGDSGGAQTLSIGH